MTWRRQCSREKGKREKTGGIRAQRAEAFKYMKRTIVILQRCAVGRISTGKCLYRLKNYDEAIRAYQDFLARHSGHSLAPIVRQSLGYAYEEKGLFQEAVQQFEYLSTHGQNFLVAQGNWDAGRCYEKLGLTSDAIRSYSKTIELSPKSNWASMAQYRLSAIR